MEVKFSYHRDMTTVKMKSFIAQRQDHFEDEIFIAQR